ncbi:pilus assembly protein PilP [Desulfobacula sp.]|uniref:pilus assembly protein PilP n=1 Tax=Desulfobacula sp. TaxID=2593537 RepID=UPI0025C29C8F|nr:pilus assembly protein PilP [Desulfobacula sp.]MBC2705225.1 pilus assembly protein PilP [Desulfobacula sp.]
MVSKSNIILLTFAVCFIFLIAACDDQPHAIKKLPPNLVSGKIIQPVIQNKPGKPEKIAKKIKLNPKNDQISEKEPKGEDGVESGHQVSEQKPDRQEKEHYDPQGKIDPFKPLIQDKPEESRVVVDEGPKRILTPLEKIDLSQIRLVAVIIMKNKRIAMVEEANGKGYEVGIGTYIGKNRGKVSEIKKSSIVITELVKDFKGRFAEQAQEIKLHKIDNEE